MALPPDTARLLDALADPAGIVLDRARALTDRLCDNLTHADEGSARPVVLGWVHDDAAELADLTAYLIGRRQAAP